MMDLNAIPSDDIVNTVEPDEKTLAKNDNNFEGNMEDFRTKHSDVREHKCRVVEDKCLAMELEIQKKGTELDNLRVRLRVLESEKAVIEEEIEALKKKKAVIEGMGIGVDDEKMVRNELSLDDCNMESVEESKIDQLMIENKVLECEKTSMLREVDNWKGKCKKLELVVLEYERRLSAAGEATIDGDHISAPGDVGSPTHIRGVRDGNVQMEGTPFIETPGNPRLHVDDSQSIRAQPGCPAKRQLVFQNGRSCDRKLASSTPQGPTTDNVDSDDEHHSPAKRRPSFQSKGTPCVTKSVQTNETVGIVDLEDTIDCKENILFIATPKRKRGPKVVFSDDECEDDESTPTKRKFKIGNTENESEEDDSLPIKIAFNRVNGNCRSDGDEEDDDDDDDDDDIPISQLKLNRARCSSQPIATRTRSCSGPRAGNFTQRQSRKRRRLVKSQKDDESCGEDESGNNPEMMNENVEVSDSVDDGSDSEADSLKSFIDEDSNIEDGQEYVVGNGTGHSTEPEDSSDSNLDYCEIISKLQRRKSLNSEWALEGEMLSDFGKKPMLCMKAVCALYRQQTADEKRCKGSIFQNGRGFSKFDAFRGSKLGEFLTDGDPNGDLVKSVKDLRKFDSDGVEVCCRLAKHYSKQLFEIYKNNEDPFFP